MKQIPLTQGLFAIVDDVDFEAISKFKWCAHKHRGGRFYAVRKGEKRCSLILMHRMISGAGPSLVVDHINHNGLDNRRENLRVCTNVENLRNANLSKNNSSGFKGVSWSKDKNKWEAYITIGGKKKSLGKYTEASDAAQAYNIAAERYFGEFALLNKVAT